MRRIMSIIAPVFFFCALSLGLNCFAEPSYKTESEVSYQEFLIEEADLPDMIQCPDMSDPASWDDEELLQFDEWWKAKAERQEIDIPNMEQIQDFFRVSTREFATDDGQSNFLYSPVSLWLCLHALSELTEGNSQAQIQRLIGEQSEEDRDAQIDAVFRSLYWEEDNAVCTPAISVWLDRNTNISEMLLKRLSEVIRSSVFQGTMGEKAFDDALRVWLNEQTRGMLEDSVSGLRLSPNTGLCVCSTLYLKNNWNISFNKDNTSTDVFYSSAGEVTAEFMHSSRAGVVFCGEGFTAVSLDFQDGGAVTFVLPDPDLSPEEVIDGDDVFRFLFSEKEWDECLYGKVNLSVPKMDCLTEISLRSMLEKMGVRDIFNPEKAQFSPEISSDSKLAVSTLKQYARMTLDENGVEAAAITVSFEGGLLRPPENEIDFLLNRPFLYAVMSEKGIPLLVGVYHLPE